MPSWPRIERWTGQLFQRQLERALDYLDGLASTSAGLAVWGGITGTLSAQTDLQGALDGKAAAARNLTAGTGLTGGGDLSADRTLALSAGSIASLALADTAVQPARNLTAGTGLTGGGNLSADRTFALSAGSIASLALADTAVQPARTITAGYGLTGGGDLSANRTLAASLGHETSALTTDVALTADNTWTDGPSVSLAAGTWLVMAYATTARTEAWNEMIYARVSDGSTHYASTRGHNSPDAFAGASIAMHAVITLAATTTIKLQLATSEGSANCLVLAALTENGAGNNATRITGIRLA
jgi:hypothetical protein